jgi:NTP pyrophosphatase (non-canonical NTP hydrolase)
MPKADLNEYSGFVKAVTSDESNYLTTFMNRLDRLDGNYESYGPNGEMQDGPDLNVSLLLTAAFGLSSETGEFNEIVKKCVFQGKKMDADTVYHLKRELGDLAFYWITGCRALNLDPNEVIAENIRKLEARYPDGKFDVYYSENRKENDL